MSARPPVPEVLRRGYMTPDVAPVRCELRATPEDFRVDEVPLYEPSGEGEHIYLRVEKRGISTAEAVRRISRRLQVPPRAIGHAGLKDARAVTVQTLSIHLHSREVEAGSLDDANLRVLDVKRHKNKLKVGHLAGNRFTLRLRGGASGEREARLVLERLAARGVANYFGLQRFGFERSTQRLGEALVREDPIAFGDWLLLGAPEAVAAPVADDEGEQEEAPEERVEGSDGEGDDAPPPPVRGRDARAVILAREKIRAGELKEAQRLLPRSFQAEHSALRARIEKRTPEACVRAVPASWRSFYVAAFQALLFNAYLNRRLERVDTLEVGEVATLHRNGASFLVVDAAAEQARCATFELSPSGPLFGHKLLRPAEGSSARADEDAVLAALAPGLGPELTQALGAKPRGERRPLRIPLREPTVVVEGDDLMVGFFLPRGSYATAVIEELRKEQTD